MLTATVASIVPADVSPSSARASQSTDPILVWIEKLTTLFLAFEAACNAEAWDEEKVDKTRIAFHKAKEKFVTDFAQPKTYAGAVALLAFITDKRWSLEDEEDHPLFAHNEIMEMMRAAVDVLTSVVDIESPSPAAIDGVPPVDDQKSRSDDLALIELGYRLDAAEEQLCAARARMRSIYNPIVEAIEKDAAWQRLQSAVDANTFRAFTHRLEKAMGGETLQSAENALTAADKESTRIILRIRAHQPETLEGLVVFAKVVRHEASEWWRKPLTDLDWLEQLTRIFVEKAYRAAGEPQPSQVAA